MKALASLVAFVVTSAIAGAARAQTVDPADRIREAAMRRAVVAPRLLNLGAEGEVSGAVPWGGVSGGGLLAIQGASLESFGVLAQALDARIGADSNFGPRFTGEFVSLRFLGIHHKPSGICVTQFFGQCDPGGFFGVSATLLRLRYDTVTDTSVFRIASAGVVLNPLNNSYSDTFINFRLLIHAGMTLDRDATGQFSPSGGTQALLGRFQAGIELLARTTDMSWQFALEGWYEPNVLRWVDDMDVRADVSVARLFLVRNLASVSLHGGYEYSSIPSRSFGEWASPLSPHSFSVRLAFTIALIGV